MSMRDFLLVIRHRWLVILAITALAAGGALAYSHHEQRVYQATATVFAHPSRAVTSPGDYSSDLGLLSYGSLSQTFASLAQSRTMLDTSAAGLRLTPLDLSHYTVAATLLPATTVLEVSVDGPDPDLVTVLANRTIARVAAATTQYFHIFALTPLDSAQAPSTRIRPLTSRNILYGCLAGLIVGFIAAALPLYGLRLIGAGVAAERETAEAEQPQGLHEQRTSPSRMPTTEDAALRDADPAQPLKRVGLPERDLRQGAPPTARAADRATSSRMPAAESTALRAALRAADPAHLLKRLRLAARAEDQAPMPSQSRRTQ